MRRFLIKISVVFIVFYTMLYAIQFFYDQGIRTSKDVEHRQWNRVATGDINAEILFLGSSRALVQYDPRIFENEMNTSAFVLGMNSTSFDLQRVVRDLYLDNNTPPKIFVQNVDITSFNKTPAFYKAPYLPYYSIKNVKLLHEVEKDAFWEWLLPMYKYRSYVQNYQKLFKYDGIIKYNGYEEKDITWDTYLEEAKTNPKRKKVDLATFDYDKGFAIMEDLIAKMDALDTELYFVWAPEYFERLPKEEPYLSMALERFRAFEKNNDHVHFLNFTKDSLIYKKDYFYNDFHLNKKGVQIYNRKVIDSIKERSPNLIID